MITLNTILVPTDFSATSEAALRYGKALADAFGASLHLVHVVQEPFSQPWAVEA
jgi:nucleotide-binding universal stress UspA family protein